MLRSARRFGVSVLTAVSAVTLFATCDPLTNTVGIAPEVDIAFVSSLGDSTLVVGRQFTAQVAITQAGTAVENARWTIVSSDPNVVRVTGSGTATQVTVVGRGTVTLTARLTETATSTDSTQKVFRAVARRVELASATDIPLSAVAGTDPVTFDGLRNFTGEKSSGVWLFSMVDNAPGATGKINYVTFKIEPKKETNSVTATILPGGIFYDFVRVPVGATNLTISVSVSPGPQPLLFFLR